MFFPRRHSQVLFLFLLGFSSPLLGLAAFGDHLADVDEVTTERPSTRLSEKSATVERWWLLRVDGEPAGSTREHRYVEHDESNDHERTTTETQTTLELSRAGQPLHLEASHRVIEENGLVVEAWTRQSFGGTTLETTYRPTDDGLEVQTQQGDRRTVELQPLSAPLGLGPRAAEDFLAKAIADGLERFEIRTLEPDAGTTAVRSVWTRTTESPTTAGALQAWQVVQDESPALVSRVEVNANGVVMRIEESLLGMVLTAEQGSRSEVLNGLRQAAVTPPEMLTPSLIQPSRPIPRPRQLRRAIYALASTGPVPPTSQAQRVETEGELRRIIVDLGPGIAEAISAPRALENDPTRNIDLTPYLAASIFIDHHAPEVRDLLSLALGTPSGSGSTEAARVGEIAETLRAFVYRHLNHKDLGTGFATASSVARSRSGDCTEHSVLLAALLRAAEIPSRVIGGLVYVDEFAGRRQVFAFHMWVQAFWQGEWRDLDPSFPAAFDAAHLGLIASALDTPSPGRDLKGLITSLATTKLEILELGPDPQRESD